jgi:BA14K-like protein
MEPKMIRLKLVSTAALMALALPLAMSSEAFAQHRGGQGGFAARGGGASFGGGAGFRGGGAATAGPRFSGGSGMTAGTRFSGGAGPGFSGRVATTSPSYGGRVATSGPSYGGNWQGGNRNWQGGNWQGGNRWAGGYGRHYRRGGGFWPGVAVGAALGGSYAYYGGSGYYDPGYYDDSYNDSYYYDDSVAVAPEGGDAATCAQTYRSYDPASGTYLGYDGQRHPCP